MILEFAVSKRIRKIRKCSKGYNCGNSCINKSLNCKKKFNDQASNYAGWLKKQGDRLGKVKSQKYPHSRASHKGITSKVPKDLSAWSKKGDLKPLTDNSRSQPEKLIEVGKAFATKYDLDNLEAKIQAYEIAAAKHYDADQERIAAIQIKVDRLQKEAFALSDEAFKAGEKGDFEKSDELFKQQQTINDRLQLPEYDTSRRFFDKYEEARSKLFNLPKDRTIERLYRNDPDRIAAEKKKVADDRKFWEAQREKAISAQPGNKEITLMIQDISKLSPLSKKEALAIFKEQAAFELPENLKPYQKRIASDFVDVIQFTGDAPKKIVITRSDDRAHARNILGFKDVDSDSPDYLESVNKSVLINIGKQYDSEISRDNSARSVMFHEYAHGIEFRHQEIAIANRKWIEKRSTSNSPQQLNTIAGGETYEDYEFAYPDKFTNPYIGKSYPKNSGNLATEVLSVGIQQLLDPRKTRELLRSDPEHFYLTLGSIIEVQNKNRK